MFAAVVAAVVAAAAACSCGRLAGAKGCREAAKRGGKGLQLARTAI